MSALWCATRLDTTLASFESQATMLQSMGYNNWAGNVGVVATGMGGIDCIIFR
jgi:hypothetical protein